MRFRGFTLIELMITMTIIGFVCLFSVPAFGGFLKDMKQKQVRANLMSDLRLARQLAVTEHSPVRVTFGDGVTTTNVTSYSVLLDTNGDGVKQSTEKRFDHTLPTGTKFNKVTLVPTDVVVFDISGVLWPSTSGGSIIVNGRTRPDTLYVSAAGIIFQP